MKKDVTAIFDIGKTNKKFFLFDKDYHEVYREYTYFDEIEDEDGFATENLQALKIWVKSLFKRILQNNEYDVKAVNVSTYGASLVHLDTKGKVLTPLYNYLKPLPEEILSKFYKKHGPEADFFQITGSPKLGMLNSGLQLFWLKYTKPDIFRKIRYSMHFPQYISYLFSGIPFSEFTSIGCHTALWDYAKKDYHKWVYREGIDRIFPPTVSAETSINLNYNGKHLKIGVGIHDSSSALIPYLRASKEPFILVSTGTWSVTLNPFDDSLLTAAEINNDMVNYMRINAKAVKSAKMHLGEEYKYQTAFLSKQYRRPTEYHKKMKVNLKFFKKWINDPKKYFHWEHIFEDEMPVKTELPFKTYEEAYHRLMIELVQVQVKNIKSVLGVGNPIKKMFIEGGFSDNDLFIKLLSYFLPEMQLYGANASVGSALGAALVISDEKLAPGFLRVNYALKKYESFKLE